MRSVWPAAGALAIGVAAGGLAWVIDMPLPWMLGPMIGTTLAAVLAAPIRGPDPLRPVVIPIIGVMLGAAISPDVVGELGAWGLTLLLLPLMLGAAASLSYACYRRIGRYDPVTAFYAAMPGGLNEMLLLGEAAGGDGRRIALAHAARVLLVIFFVALFFGLVLGVRSGAGGGTWIGLADITLRDYGVLAACAVAGVPLARWLRLPAAPVFGPMILSGIVHLLGWVTVPPPSLLIVMAQVVMGTIIGCRFLGAKARDILRDLVLAVPASLAMLVVAVIMAVILTWLNGMPLAQAFLAFSPGGLTEMSLLTLTLDQDVAFVSVMHIVRISAIIAVAPVAFRIARRWMGPQDA